MPDMKSRLRSQLAISQQKQEQLDKIKRLFDQKARRLVIEIGNERFNAADCPSFSFDPSSNDDSIQLVRPTSFAELEIQDLTYKARSAGAAGDAVSVEYEDYDPAVAASKEIQDLTFTAKEAGEAGNDITIEYTDGATAGMEMVSVVDSAITVQIESGVSTAQNIKDAIEGAMAADDLVSVAISGMDDPQTAPVAATNLEGGLDAVGDAGNEVVTVMMDAIVVKLESGVSTAAQVKAAVDASEDASELVEVLITGTAGDAQTAPVAEDNLAGGDSPELYDNSDIIFIKRLRNKKYLIKLAHDADPEAA